MAGAIAQIYASLDLNSAKFRSSLDKTMKKSKEQLSEFQKFNRSAGEKAGKMLAGVFATGAAAAAVAGVKIRQTANELDEVTKRASRLNIATEAMIGLEHAASLAGVANSTLERSMLASNKAAKQAQDGSASYKRIFDELKISTEAYLALTPDQQMLKLADSLQNVESEQRKLAIATELFGSRGASMLNLLKQGSDAMREQMEEAKQLGITISEIDGAGIEQMNDSFNRAGKVLKGFWTQLTVNVAPVLSAVASLFTEASTKSGDFAEAGVKGAGLVEKAVFGVANAVHFIKGMWLEFKVIANEGVEQGSKALSKWYGLIAKGAKSIGWEDMRLTYESAAKGVDESTKNISASLQAMRKEALDNALAESPAERLEAKIKEMRDKAAKAANQKPVSAQLIDFGKFKDNNVGSEAAAKAKAQEKEQAKARKQRALQAANDEFVAVKQQMLLQMGMKEQAEDARWEQEKQKIAARRAEALLAVGSDQEARALIEDQYRAIKEQKEVQHGQAIAKIQIDQAKKVEATKKQMFSKQLNSAGQFFGNLAGLARENSKEQANLQLAQGAVSAVMTGINTMNSASAAGMPPPIPQILAGAAVAAQVASLARARAEAGKFEYGGIVGGSSYTGDKLNAQVNSGEMILNRGQQKNLFDIANGKNASSSASGASWQVVINNYGEPSEVRNVKIDERMRTIALEVVSTESDEINANNLSNPNSKTSEVMSSAYGDRQYAY